MHPFTVLGSGNKTMAEMMEADKTYSAKKRYGERKEEDVDINNVKMEYFEEEHTTKTEFKEEIEFEYNNQLDLKDGSFMTEGESENNLKRESLKSPNPQQDDTKSNDIFAESCRVDNLVSLKKELRKQKEKYKNAVEVNNLRLTAERVKHEEEMKTTKEEMQWLLDKAMGDLEETKNTKLELTAEREKHGKEMTSAKEEVLNHKMRNLLQERELVETRIKLGDVKVELAAEREKHEKEIKTAKEEMLKHKMRQLLLERDLEESEKKLKDEKKKHKKNLKNFLHVLKQSQSVLKKKKRVVYPQADLFDLSAEVLELGDDDTESGWHNLRLVLISKFS